MGYVIAQQTLHEFVGNADRPYYVTVGDDTDLAKRVGSAWQVWLERHRDGIEWCEPWPSDELLWR